MMMPCRSLRSTCLLLSSPVDLATSGYITFTTTASAAAAAASPSTNGRVSPDAIRGGMRDGGRMKRAPCRAGAREGQGRRSKEGCEGVDPEVAE